MPISYELAKKLKDRGFPQPEYPMGKGSWEEEKGADIIPGITPHSIRQKMLIYLPTLSELIEACGDRFSTLEQMTGDACEYDWVKEEGTWHAEYSIGISPQECASGFTPEEAVANLWIKLNKVELK